MFNNYFSPFKQLLKKMDFVTREEFEVQKTLVVRLKARLKELEAKLNTLEQNKNS